MQIHQATAIEHSARDVIRVGPSVTECVGLPISYELFCLPWLAQELGQFADRHALSQGQLDRLEHLLNHS